MSIVIPLSQPVRIRTYCYAPTISQVGINTTYWNCSNTTLGGVTDRELAAAWDAAVAPIYRPLMPATARYSAAGVSLMQPPPSTKTLTSEVRVITSRAAGTAAGNLAPKQVSMVVAFKSGFASRHENGRVYPPFPAATYFDTNGEVNGGGIAATAAIAAFYAAPFNVIGAGGTATFTLQVRSVVKQVRPLPDIATYIQVVQSIGRSITGTQRRRSDYGRLNSEPTAA